MADQQTVPSKQQTPTPSQTPTQAPGTSGGLSTPRVQLKRGVQQMGFDEQAALLTPDEPVQRKGGEDTEKVHAAAAHGIASGGGAMPHSQQIQSAFGSHDISGIQAHTGGAAKEANKAMGAEAFASGSHVAFANTPDLHTAAHEAAHIVQQGAGVSLSGGVGQVGDKYENHADKVADAVVSGKSAEPILNEMTGGGAKGGTQKKKSVQQLAAGDAVQMAPAPAPAPSPAPAPAPTDPESQWRTYCDGLEGPVKAAALLITDAAKRDKFKTLNPVEMRSYADAGMTAALRDEFLAFARWQDRTALTVMLANAPHFALYTTLASPAERAKFRDITPDERQNLTTIPAAQVSILLTDEAKLNEWRTYRNVQAVSANPAVLGALGVTDPADAPKIAEELAKLSSGKAGERLRRLITEQGFETPSHREDSIKDIRDRVKAGAEPFAAMEAAKDTWVLKGKLTKNDGSFPTVPILKAIPYVSMCQYGTLDPAFKDELISALGKTPDAATRADFDANKPAQAGAGFRAWKAAGGVFNPGAHVTSYSVQGRGNAGAYWMYDARMAAVCDPAVGGQDVIKACAIEESPEYNSGFVIVQLPTTDPAMANSVRRPTMWDGLQFDQFAGVDSPTQCFGVTSGRVGEVVVAPTPFSACTVRRQVRM